MIPTLALMIWPFVTAAIFVVLRPAAALVATITGGYLLLPPGFGIDFPLLPTFDEQSVPALSALVFLAFAAAQLPAAQMRPGWLPRSRIALFLIAGLVAGAFMTVMTNSDPLFLGDGRMLRGMSTYDAFSFVLQSLVMILPLLLARKFLATSESHRTLLLILVVAGLGYSLLALYEVRMSPQLNRMVYGYFPHSWIQHLRGGGFRPLVFLTHGLILSLFLAMTVLAAIGCARLTSAGSWAIWYAAAGWLFMALVLSKSLGALGITLILAPVALLLSPRLQVLAAAAIAATIITYPVLRSAHLVPVGAVLQVAESIDPARARSFNTRVVNEDQLLEKAQQRPLFGWGGYARNRVYDERGRDISITDGYWIIAIGQGGWTRYVGEFGLMVLPLVFLAWRWRQIEVGPETAVLALIMAANLIDLIPNSGMMPITWLLAGALWGRLEIVRAEAPQDAPAAAPRRVSRYSREGLEALPEREGAAPPTRDAGPVYSRFRGGETTQESSTKLRRILR